MKSLFRKLILILGDCGCLYFATFIGIFFEGTVLGNKVEPRIDYHIRFLSIMLLLMLVFFNVYGLFSIIRKRLLEIFLNLIVALFNIFIVALAITFWFRDFSFSRAVLIYTGFVAFILLAIWNFIMHKWEAVCMPQQRVAICAEAAEYQRIAPKLHRSYDYENAIVKHFYVNDLEKDNTITTILIGDSLSITDREKALRIASKYRKQILLVPKLYEISCVGMKLMQFDDLPVQKLSNMELTLEQRVLKRLVDLSISIPGMFICFPILFILGLAIKIDSIGPIIYSQKRVGIRGKLFYVYKLRSMRQDAEKLSGPVLATEDDPRITRVGKFIRATRLDEIPQLFNVLIGDMSLVGPRPERPVFVEQFIAEKPEYVYRHNVKPGITGLAQVNGKYNTSAYDKLVYDLLYIQNYSIANDFIIMLQTLKVMITKSATEGIKNIS